MEAEFGLLGEIELQVDGRAVDVGHARQRCVLAVLAIEANRVVSVDALVERVWGDRAPQRARETLYNYLSRLRRVLSSITELALVRQPGGYVLTADPMMVDLHRFHHLLAQARLVEDEDQALGLLKKALELWRGEPFSGVDTDWLTALRVSLERDRFAAELDCADLYLRRGQHSWLLSELFTRAQAYPLDERVAGQLMLALYQCGRQAEALEYFQQLRAHLAEELGIDPCPELQRRYEQILSTDPTLTADPPTPSVSAPVSALRPVPRQLPTHIPHFVGRDAELHQLTTLLNSTSSGNTVVIIAIDGTAGIGKTALALHWAHRAAEQFTDGQLYVNLRGFDPTNTPVHPTEALQRFLEAMGISPEQIPTSLEAQSGLYRSMLTDRRVLVVLDNARDAEQIRPLLPASATCVVVITSRDQLTGLITQQGARPLTLDTFSPQEARALLARHLGGQRLSAEPDAVTELVEYCAGLPLALAIVAARAATHPSFALRALAKELADTRTRLDALDTGEAITSVRTVFSWSYHHRSPPAARMFRFLGLHPGPDIALPAATHLTGTPLHQARGALNELTRAHLLTQHTPGRYTFHDLLRAYASHLTTTQDTPEDHRAALTRLFDHYLHTATAAMNILQTPVRSSRPQHPPTALPTPPLADPSTAQDWLNAERTNLAAIITYTATHGWHTHTTQLANTVLLGYYETGIHYPHALTLYTHVQRAAHHTNDHITQALALTYLGLLYWRHGCYPQATDHHEQALIISRKAGDRTGEARALTHLGVVHGQQGRYPQAIHHYLQALAISRQIGDRFGEAHALTCLGFVYGRQGRYPQASDHLQQALAISRQIGDRFGEAHALNGLGRIYRRQGRYPQATDHHHQALTISRDTGDRTGTAFALNGLGLIHGCQGHYPRATDHHQQTLMISRDIGDRTGEALALNGLGLIHRCQGHYPQATDHHQQALMISRDIGNRADEAEILNNLGEAHYADRQLDHAFAQHTTALTLATEIGDRCEQAHAHHGLAHAYHTTGNLNQAQDHWQHALALYIDLDIPIATVCRRESDLHL